MMREEKPAVLVNPVTGRLGIRATACGVIFRPAGGRVSRGG